MCKIFYFVFIIFLLVHCEGFNEKERELIGRIYKSIDIEKMQTLDVVERKKYFLKVLYQNEDLKNLVFKEASELGFMKRDPWEKNVFPCQNYSIPGSGTSVRNLTPLDIKVIAALGDSLTAGIGIGAKNIYQITLEDRGKVFDIGGKEGAQTLPNMFKIFNPNIKGYSTKVTFYGSKGDAFNVAVSGQTSEGLMEQV